MLMKDEWKECERKNTETFCLNRDMAIDTLALERIWLT
jgi:hypothetical protein